MSKSEFQVIRHPKTKNETVVQTRAFEESQKLYAPYVAIDWSESKHFKLVDNKVEAKAEEKPVAEPVKQKAAKVKPEPVSNSKTDDGNKVDDNKTLDKKPV